nr:hypothetical protein [Tanacetum cinerariifolium]
NSVGEKGIKRDYSTPRTPQQNGVAEKKNKTLIEAARTMLADSKLPTMFWTEAVSTALTILNTSDHLGKFEGKADEGYLVGYASNSAQATNIIAGNPDDDSNSEYNEQVIVVPSFPSNSFDGPSSSNGPSVIERNADYAKELARLQRQEYEAKDAAERYGYFSLDPPNDGHCCWWQCCCDAPAGAAAGGDAADEANVVANDATGGAAEAPQVPQSPLVSPVREPTPERQPTLEPWRYVHVHLSEPESPPFPPEQTVLYEEPVEFGPVPRPTWYVDPDDIEPIFFGPQPRPMVYVEHDFEVPIFFGPQPRPDNYVEPEEPDVIISMEDDTIHGGFHVESPVWSNDAPKPTVDAAGRAEDPSMLTILPDKLDRCMGRIATLEKDLGTSKQVMGGAILKLVNRVKRLENQAHLRRLAGGGRGGGRSVAGRWRETGGKDDDQGIEMEQENIQERNVLSIDYHRPFIQVTAMSIEFLKSSMPMR